MIYQFLSLEAKAEQVKQLSYNENEISHRFRWIVQLRRKLKREKSKILVLLYICYKIFIFYLEVTHLYQSNAQAECN